MNFDAKDANNVMGQALLKKCRKVCVFVPLLSFCAYALYYEGLHLLVVEL